MKMTRRTIEEIENEKIEKIAALQQFKKGDRVFDKLTKEHGVYSAPNLANSMPSCWVRFDVLLGDQWFIPPEKDPGSADPLNLELCQCNKPIPPLHDLLQPTASPEEVETQKALLEPDIALCGLSSPINLQPVFTAEDSPTLSLLKPISENLQTNLFPHSHDQTSLSSAVLVQTFPLLEREPELLEITQACFLKDSDFCDFKALRLSFLKMLPDSSAATTDLTSILSLVPSRNWGMWGVGTNETESVTSPRIEDGSSLWVLTGNVQCSKIEPNRLSLDECLDSPGVIIDRHISGDRIYDTIAPTIRSCARSKDGHQSGGGQYKVRDSNGNIRPLTGNEFEKIMGWKTGSTATGATKQTGEVVTISTTQRHRMLGNGIIPAEIEDICNSLRPFLERTIGNESAIADYSLAPEVNNESAIAGKIGCGSASPIVPQDADSQIMGEEEARFTIKEINSACNKIRCALVDLDERKGYIALGYRSMSQLLKSNLFSKAKSTLHLELVAGKIESGNLKVPVGTFSESQLRSLPKLKSDYHGEAIALAKEIAGDRPLMAKDVSLAVAQLVIERPETRKKSIVDVIKEKTFTPCTELSEYADGDVVMVTAIDNSTIRYLDGYWGIVSRISSFAYHVCISVKNETVACKGDEMKRIDLGEKDKKDIQSVSDRILALAMLMELDDVDRAQLEVMQRRIAWTSRQLQALAYLEEIYDGSLRLVKLEQMN